MLNAAQRAAIVHLPWRMRMKRVSPRFKRMDAGASARCAEGWRMKSI